jgi:hypothetical protein
MFLAAVVDATPGLMNKYVDVVVVHVAVRYQLCRKGQLVLLL